MVGTKGVAMDIYCRGEACVATATTMVPANRFITPR